MMTCCKAALPLCRPAAGPDACPCSCVIHIRCSPAEQLPLACCWPTPVHPVQSSESTTERGRVSTRQLHRWCCWHTPDTIQPSLPEETMPTELAICRCCSARCGCLSGCHEHRKQHTTQVVHCRIRPPALMHPRHGPGFGEQKPCLDFLCPKRPTSRLLGWGRQQYHGVAGCWPAGSATLFPLTPPPPPPPLPAHRGTEGGGGGQPARAGDRNGPHMPLPPVAPPN